MSNNSRPFSKRVAILGSSFGTRVTAPALRAEGWEIVALFSRRAHRAAEIAAMLDIPHHSDDFRAIVSRGRHRRRRRLHADGHPPRARARRARPGKHVLCEKPFTMTEAEAREMIAAAAATDRTTMVNFESATPTTASTSRA